jgi:hypothetical protein
MVQHITTIARIFRKPKVKNNSLQEVHCHSTDVERLHFIDTKEAGITITGAVAVRHLQASSRT